jgi:hypothetical protein
LAESGVRILVTGLVRRRERSVRIQFMASSLCLPHEALPDPTSRHQSEAEE